MRYLYFHSLFILHLVLTCFFFFHLSQSYFYPLLIYQASWSLSSHLPPLVSSYLSPSPTPTHSIKALPLRPRALFASLSRARKALHTRRLTQGNGCVASSITAPNAWMDTCRLITKWSYTRMHQSGRRHDDACCEIHIAAAAPAAVANYKLWGVWRIHQNSCWPTELCRGKCSSEQRQLI